VILYDFSSETSKVIYHRKRPLNRWNGYILHRWSLGSGKQMLVVAVSQAVFLFLRSHRFSTPLYHIFSYSSMCSTGNLFSLDVGGQWGPEEGDGCD
jgi:hypothetical protein